MLEIELDQELFLPCYWHLLEPNDFIIEFVWGGRDSGKSQHVAQQLVKESIDLDYFRCVLIKKTAESIKDSQWQTIKDISEDWGVDQFFKFNTNPLEIKCNNGNKFIARGCDNPGKLKSIRNPSHVWIEEGDQLTLQDFTTILTTLRSDYGKVKVFFVFNPELPKGIIDKKDFWLYKNWFSHINEKNFTATKTFTSRGKEITLSYRSTHTTYIDNPYCTDERIAFNESLKTENPSKYLPYTLGEWGSYSNDMPFFYSYNNSKHYTHERYVFNSDYGLDIGFDFNIAPCCAVVGQYNRHDLSWHVFDVIIQDPTNKYRLSPLAAVCMVIKEKYVDTGLVPAYKIRVTGDASGRNGSADRVEAVTFYTTIMRCLGIKEQQLTLRRINTPHVFSGEVINSALYNIPHGHLLLHDVPELEKDIKLAYPDKDKSLNEVKNKRGLHVLDAWRYLMDMWFANNGDYMSDTGTAYQYIKMLVKRINNKSA